MSSLAEAFGSPTAYSSVLDRLRNRPDLTSLGVGAAPGAHSLDEIVAGSWPAALDQDQYKYQHVEHLLDQAADLLDRGVRDRTQWEDLYEKWLKNVLELREFLAVDEVQKREEEAGIFEVAFTISQAEQAANAAMVENMKLVCARLETILQNNLNVAERQNLATRQGVLASWAKHDSGGSNAIQVGAPPEYGGPGDVAGRSANVTTYIASRELEIDSLSFDAQLQQAKASLEAARARVDSLSKKAEYDGKDREFKLERRKIMRQIAAAKQLATSIEGGALNFEGRMAPIQARYENDFREAIAKIQAAALGLKLIYGYEEALPQPMGVSRLRFFDDCLIWVRNAISFVVKSGKLDQSYVTSFSLKRQCGASWNEGLSSGVFRFSIAESDLSQGMTQRYVRLRGFSAVVTGEAAKGTWQAIVRAPRASFSTHKNGVRRDLDQSRAAACLAGRVTSRTAIMPPDILGGVEFYNLSPYGDWEFRLPKRDPAQPPKSLEGVSIAPTDDIQLDLHVVARVQA